jgi:diguanylate cyclase (GGDEF)-like protein
MRAPDRRLSRQITACLLACVAVTFVTVVVLATWMAKRHDAEAAATSRTMVAGGLDAASRRLRALTNDYAWWDEAYQAYERGDRAWVDANIGTGITGTGIADAMLLVSPRGSVDYGWVKDEDGPKSTEIISPDAVAQTFALIHDAPIEQQAARFMFTKAPGGGVVMIGAARLVPFTRVETVAAKDLPVLIMAQFLNEDRLNEMGASFLLQDLKLVEKAEPDGLAMAIRDINGTQIGTLAWTPPRPGSVLLQRAVPSLFAALLVFCGLMLVIARRAQVMAVAMSASERRAMAAAKSDPLTQLLNRTGFNDLLTSEKCQEAARRGELVAMYLDVNGFKGVNDSVGHHGGDELIQLIAQRFRNVLSANAHLARVGGDEFAVLLLGQAVREVQATASSLAGALDRPFLINGVEFHITCAIGYAEASETNHDPDELLRQADLAMYVAKSTGQRGGRPFHWSMETDALVKKQLEDRLRRGLDQGELHVEYQPIVRAADESVETLEALVRWRSRSHGVIPPGHFIQVAEESGFIREIGQFVLDQVCKDLARWPHLRVAVNISPVQLRDPDFVDQFIAILTRNRVRPDQIEVELTEGVLVGDTAQASAKLTRLRELGVTISLDDFGTGYSSISYLKSFPFSRVKIDRSFVHDLGRSDKALDLLRSMVGLADAMGLTVVAEGVETMDQVRLLRMTGCGFIQGYLVQSPAAPDVISEFIRKKGDAALVKLSGALQPPAIRLV